MSIGHEPQTVQRQRNPAPKIASFAVALLLAACQYAVVAPGTPAATPAGAGAEPAASSLQIAAETAAPSSATAGLIQLRDPLDEPEQYCVDVPGFGRSLNLQGALTAHTCKPGADDEMFLLDAPSPGQIWMPAYSMCVEASSADAGSTLHLAACSASPLQQFQYTDSALIRLASEAGEGLCLTVASGTGAPTGGPSHLRRDLTLESCDLAEAARSHWTVGSATVIASEPPSEK